jgi:CHAT domain-containing protein
MALAQGGYDTMTSDQLRVEMAKVQAELSAAAQAGKKAEALALGEKLKVVAKAYGESFQRASVGVSKGAPVSQGKVESLRAKLDSWAELSTLIEGGDIERGLNRMEDLSEDLLSAKDSGLISLQNAGLAISLAGLYVELVRDVDRSHELARKAEEYCDHHLGSAPDLTDGTVRTWMSIRQGARAQRAVALSLLGRTRDVKALGEESASRWKVLRENLLSGQKPPYSETIQAFLYGGTLTLTVQMTKTGDAFAARSSGKADAEAAYRGALEALEAYLPTVPKPVGPMAAIRVSRIGMVHAFSAYIHRQLGELAEARKRYQMAFESFVRYRELNPGAPDFWTYARPRLEYAEILLEAGEHGEALAAIEEARKDFESLRAKPGHEAYFAQSWKPAYLEARVREDSGEADAAIEAYLRSVGELEGYFSKMRSGQLKGAFLKIEECRDAYRRLVTLLLEAKREEEALAILERSKSAALLDKLRSLPLRRNRSKDEDLQRRERELKKKIRGLRQELEGKGPKKPSETRSASTVNEELSEARWQYELFLRKVDVKIVEDAPQAEGFDQVWYRPPEELLSASQAQGDRVVVTYFDDGEVVRAFVLRGGELTVHECGASRKLEKAVAKLRRNVAARSRRWSRPAQDLHDSLITPFQQRLEGAEELVIVPTGFLYALPFACLGPKDGEPLAARIPLSVTSQASLVADAREARPVPVPRLLVGDPDGSLPSAKVEAERIAAACPDAEACELLLGEEATEGRIKDLLGHSREGPAPGVVHFATHGLLLRGRELFSTLTLAPDAIEDGDLSVGEIYMDLDLLETPVVVLSACNTAIGEEGGGDEVLGLSRAFQYAGARWVVASLWEVSDEASAALMEEFHLQLAKTGRVDQALAAAMTKTRSAKGDWAHPYYWAPFAAFRR